jgi:peptidoglycan/xylan/chitin deacetylase (PgdA/CDA1 family)
MKVRGKLRSAIHRIWSPPPRPLILMYHRIAEDPIDHWGLSVSPANFEGQLHVLRRTRRPLPLVDFVRDLMTGTLPPEAVAVTFDDGYVDNLTAGKPRLAKADVPATVFVASGYTGRPGEFWWDELSGLILAGRGRRNFELMIGRETLRVDLKASTGAQEDDTISASGLKARQTALTPIWDAMRRLNDDERQSAMARIRLVLTDQDSTVDRGRAMTRDEVRTLAADGLVTIGAHTVTHPQLSALEKDSCQREISDSKSDCEALTGAAVTSFAYPYGDFDDKAREAVLAAGFAFACSTRPAPATMASDLLALPRIQICNWDGDTFERAIRSSAGSV